MRVTKGTYPSYVFFDIVRFTLHQTPTKELNFTMSLSWEKSKGEECLFDRKVVLSLSSVFTIFLLYYTHRLYFTKIKSILIFALCFILLANTNSIEMFSPVFFFFFHNLFFFFLLCFDIDSIIQVIWSFHSMHYTKRLLIFFFFFFF